MTVLGDELAKKLAEKANDINTFVWKGPKVNGIQGEIRLIDADYKQLNKFYKHSMEMLYNKDFKNPGRQTLLDIVQDQILRCRAELLIRWLRSEKQYTTSNCLEDLKVVISNSKLTQEDIKTTYIEQVMNGLPLEFKRIPINIVMDACLDRLGILDSSHITLNFITKMGLWFTPQELQKDLYRKDPVTGKAMNRLNIVREEQKIHPNIKLHVDTTGLSYAEFKSMCKLKKDKYTNLTSDQLRLLSNKILYRFQNQCELQSLQWKNKIDEILKVAEFKGWDVTRETY